MVKVAQIALKKRHGQNFLIDTQVPALAIERVSLTPSSLVLEIGGGAGFLTEPILQKRPAQLTVFEIDEEWANFLAKKFAPELADRRLQLMQQDFLTVDLAELFADNSWTILANLPYHLTFPIFEKFVLVRKQIAEGVVMVQEEVAQKITKSSGRGYGAISLYLQHYFNWRLLEKIPPTAFRPAPKVYSRLLYFQPKSQPLKLKDEPNFWKFVRSCFKFPRRTLRNNLAQTHYPWQKLSDQTLGLRAQQLQITDFIEIWQQLT